METLVFQRSHWASLRDTPCQRLLLNMTNCCSKIWTLEDQYSIIAVSSQESNRLEKLSEEANYLFLIKPYGMQLIRMVFLRPFQWVEYNEIKPTHTGIVMENVCSILSTRALFTRPVMLFVSPLNAVEELVFIKMHFQLNAICNI